MRSAEKKSSVKYLRHQKGAQTVFDGIEPYNAMPKPLLGFCIAFMFCKHENGLKCTEHLDIMY